MRRLAPYAAAGLALLAVGVAVALLVERTTGLVLALVGVGLLIPLRPGRRPGDRAARRSGGEPADPRRRSDARGDGPDRPAA